MNRNGKDVPELVRIAEQLTSDIETLEHLSRGVCKLRTDSDKNIARAGRELNEALKAPERLSHGLVAFSEAMQSLQQRQQTALEPLLAFATELQRRATRLQELKQVYSALGGSASELHATLQGNDDPKAALSAAAGRLSEICEQAAALNESASEEGFMDLSRDADAIRQSAIALRKRLMHVV
jgi:DNA repair ATPase RecN